MLKKLKDVAPDTWARTICLLLAMVNQVLAIFGKGALPFAENDIYQIVSLAATIITGMAAWWKNNSFTPEAKLSDKILKEMKSGEKGA